MTLTAHKTLSQLCAIGAGYAVRKGLPVTERGGVSVVQMGDVPDFGTLRLTGLQRAELDGTLERYKVRAGDIVFRARGNQNTAHLIEAGSTESAIALLPLMVLRASPDVDSGYLAWAINQPEGQRHLDREAQGSATRMISREALESLPIPVTDLDTQQRIAATHALALEEFRLASELAEKRRLLADTLIGLAVRQDTHTKERSSR